jgi:glutathione S-transferase
MRILHGSYGKYEVVDYKAQAQYRGMDLYISPLSCSLAAHIACLEAALPVTLHRVDRKTKHLDDGRDFRTIAPQAVVPVISLPEGDVLTESVAVLQYIADHAPASSLAPAWGSPERYRLIEWLNFVTTELHKKHLWSIFSSKTTPELKTWSRANAAPALDHAARHLADRTYLVGEQYTVADIYMFWALLIFPHGGVSLDAYPTLRAYAARIQERPAVKQALALEYPMYQREQAALAS